MNASWPVCCKQISKEKVMGMTGRFFEQGKEGIDRVAAPHQFTSGDARRYAEQGAQQFLSEYGNLLSCFTLHGEFGLWARLQTYLQTMGLGNVVNQAVEDGDVAAYISGIFLSQVNAFVTLFERGALTRLQIADPLPEAAAEELSKLRKYAGVKASSAAPAVPQPAALTPTEQCAQAFQDLSASSFKTKYMSNQNGRKIYEQTLAEGKIS
jgi:hypothetical protein